MPDPAQTVEVVQADREAAADTCSVIWNAKSGDDVRNGLCDSFFLVQAFARHRIAHTTPPKETSDLIGLRELLAKLRRTRTEVKMRSLFGGAMALPIEGETREAPINPDGPEAADTIERQQERLVEAGRVLQLCLAREEEWAKLRGYSDCSCMALSRDAEREYETGTCPHQKARAASRWLQDGKGEGE